MSPFSQRGNFTTMMVVIISGLLASLALMRWSAVGMKIGFQGKIRKGQESRQGILDALSMTNDHIKNDIITVTNAAGIPRLAFPGATPTNYTLTPGLPGLPDELRVRLNDANLDGWDDTVPTKNALQPRLVFTEYVPATLPSESDYVRVTASIALPDEVTLKAKIKVVAAPPPPFSIVNLDFLVAGASAGCGLDTPTGRVYCWGDNSFGQLGQGAGGIPDDCGGTNCSASPIQVDMTDPLFTAPVRTFTRISAAGDGHICGLVWTFANPTGMVVCWGKNDYFQLGHPGGGKPAYSGHDASNVVAGGNHTCSFNAVTVRTRCWGRNHMGQVGAPSDSNCPADGTPQCRLNATAAPGALLADGIAVQKLALGQNHSCALTTVGDVYCWGDNTDGQVGVVGSVSYNSAVLVGSGYRDLVAGPNHTCALTTVALFSEIYCWGDNSDGQLGTGVIIGSPTPVLSTTANAAPGANISLVSDPQNNRTCFFTDDIANPYHCVGVDPLTGTQYIAATFTGGVNGFCGTSFCCGAVGPGACFGIDTRGQLGNGP